MKRAFKWSVFVVGGVILSALGAIAATRWINAAESPNVGRTAAAATPTSKGGDLFIAFVSVLRHPRCMNCHSQGDFPRQGDDGHQHAMNVRRGPDGHGVTAEKCSTCHQDHNVPGPHMPPGALSWGLPPLTTPMIWQDLTDAQICRSIKNPKENRNRNIEQLVEHLTEDKLVAWGWNPGEGRTPIPMPQDEFATKVKQWQAAGAPCPSDTTQKTKP
jgi:hypothetical protein